MVPLFLEEGTGILTEQNQFPKERSESFFQDQTRILRGKGRAGMGVVFYCKRPWFLGTG